MQRIIAALTVLVCLIYVMIVPLSIFGSLVWFFFIRAK